MLYKYHLSSKTGASTVPHFTDEANKSQSYRDNGLGEQRGWGQCTNGSEWPRATKSRERHMDTAIERWGRRGQGRGKKTA